MTWLLKVEVEDKASADKIERVIDSMSRSNHPVKLIDIEFEELEEEFAAN